MPFPMFSQLAARRYCLGELEFDTAVSTQVGVTEAQWSSIISPEPGRHQPVPAALPSRSDLHDGNRPGRGQFPVRPEGRGRNRPDVGVSIDPKHPVRILGDACLKVPERRGELIEFRVTLRGEFGGAAVEENFRLEHEAVAHNLDVVALTERSFQLPKKVSNIQS